MTVHLSDFLARAACGVGAAAGFLIDPPFDPVLAKRVVRMYPRAKGVDFCGRPTEAADWLMGTALPLRIERQALPPTTRPGDYWDGHTLHVSFADHDVVVEPTLLAATSSAEGNTYEAVIIDTHPAPPGWQRWREIVWTAAFQTALIQLACGVPVQARVIGPAYYREETVRTPTAWALSLLTSRPVLDVGIHCSHTSRVRGATVWSCPLREAGTCEPPVLA